ncbi:MAG: LytTR family transcriptional regulator [Bacteroidetes bacterium]|nr:LytTR family transcriptional regulator [Bacteroidota bacterium]
MGPNQDDHLIALPDKNGLNFFEIRKIIRCQSDNSYTEFFILNESNHKLDVIKIVVSKGFDHFENFLLTKGFFYRVHNKHIVNIYHIDKYIKSDGGYLTMADDTNVVVPVARARKEGFMKHLKSMGILV